MAISADIKHITIVKSFAGTGTGEYTNVYAVNCPGELDNPDLIATALELARVEQRFTGVKVVFKTARIQYATGKDAAGKKHKAYNEVLGFVGLAPLTFGAYDDTAFGGTAIAHKVPPAEVVLAVNFAAGSAGLGVHTYRHAIAETNWDCDGGAITLHTDFLTAQNNVWSNYLQGPNAKAPLVMISGKGLNAFASPITSIKVAGARNRQLENRRTGKKDDFDVDKNTPEQAEKTLERAVEVLQEVETGRFSDNGGRFFQSAAFMGAIASIVGAAQLVKASKDNMDYRVPVGP